MSVYVQVTVVETRIYRVRIDAASALPLETCAVDMVDHPEGAPGAVELVANRSSAEAVELPAEPGGAPPPLIEAGEAC